MPTTTTPKTNRRVGQSAAKPVLSAAQKKAARAATARGTAAKRILDEPQHGETEDTDAIDTALEQANLDATPSKATPLAKSRNTAAAAAKAGTLPAKPAKTPDTPKPPRITGPSLMHAALEHTGRPMHSNKISEHVMANGGDKIYTGLTPYATMAAQLATSNKTDGQFIRTEPGVFALRAWPAAKLQADPIKPERAPRAERTSRVKPAPSAEVEAIGDTLCLAIDSALTDDKTMGGVMAKLDLTADTRTWLASRIARHIRTLA